MQWISILSVVLAMTATALSAHATVNSDCSAPQGGIEVALPSGLPAALRDALPGDIALPGERFDTTDIYVKGHKHRRYLFVWNIGTKWIVATQIGGIALRADISTYELSKDGKTAALIEDRFTIPEGVCAAATKLADAKNFHPKLQPK